MSVFSLLLGLLPLLAGCLKVQPGEVVYAGNTLDGQLKIEMGLASSCYVHEGALWCAGNHETIGVQTNFLNQGTPQRVIASGVESVEIGDEHACARVNDDLYCWGENPDGQVGDNSTSDRPTPVLIIDGGVQSFAVGSDHSCAVVSGALKCWGRNTSYQLGDGLTADVLIPKTIIASGVTKVFAGFGTTCATVNGVLKCWGENSDNEVGTDTGTDVQTPTTVLNKAVSEMSFTEYNTCALAGSTAYCWGDYYASNTPAIFLNGVSQLSSGAEFTCAILSDDLRCWGWYRYYLLDENDPYEDSAWQQVGTVAKNVDYVAAGGYGGLCYVRGSQVYCGGEDYDGTLFRGSNGSYVLDFVKVFDEPFTKLKALGPATCGRTAGGQMYCAGGGAGSRYFGFLQGNAYPTFTAVVSGVSDFGLASSLGCYVRSGTLECAGIHTVWTLGDGATTTSTTPITIVASGVTDVELGPSNQCYIEAGALYCWGEGGNGLLGQGDTVDATTPVEVISSGVTKVSMSSTIICAVVSGDLYCWGRNNSGQVGLGTISAIENTPQLVLTGGVTSVAVAANHACVLQSGAVKCWGSNFYGAVGLPATTASQTTPATIIASGATQLTESMGWGQAFCAIVTGELYCWGKEAFHVGGVFTPQLVETVGVPVLVTQSGPVLCYHNSAGETYCRGNNSYDRVGFEPQVRFSLGLWNVSL